MLFSVWVRTETRAYSASPSFVKCWLHSFWILGRDSVSSFLSTPSSSSTNSHSINVAWDEPSFLVSMLLSVNVAWYLYTLLSPLVSRYVLELSFHSCVFPSILNPPQCADRCMAVKELDWKCRGSRSCRQV